MKERERESEQRLEALLERIHERALLVRHLLVDVVLTKRKHWDKRRAVLERDLDEAEPLLEREVRRTRVRCEALRRAADDDHDCLARPAAEYAPARRLGHRADALCEQQLAVERELEVGREREQVRCQPGEGRAEPSDISCKRRDRAPACRSSA